MAVDEGAAGWEAFYSRESPPSLEPDADLLAHVDLFRASQVKRVLDLGCGEGRHLVFLGKRGCEMYGLDFAPTALKLSKERLDREKLHADLRCGDMSELPWPDQFFDAVVSIRVLHHHRIRSIRRTVDEIHRVLRPGGYLFATAMKEHPPKDWKGGKFEKIEPSTYVPLEGHEKGVPHCGLSQTKLKELLSMFAVLFLRDVVSQGPHYVFLAQKIYHSILSHAQKPL